MTYNVFAGTLNLNQSIGSEEAISLADASCSTGWLPGSHSFFPAEQVLIVRAVWSLQAMM